MKKERKKQQVGRLVLNRETLERLGSDQETLKYVAAASNIIATCTLSPHTQCP